MTDPDTPPPTGPEPSPSHETAAPAPMDFRARLHEIIFEADTAAGKAFDIVLLVSIVASIGVVCLESVEAFRARHGALLATLEWLFTIVFTIEYVLRLWLVEKRWVYASSFYGVVDLLAVIPTYLSPFIPGAQAMLVIRSLRLLRVFRVLKLTRYVRESRQLFAALRASVSKILVFLYTVLTVVVIIGAVMFQVEGPENGFTSIPVSIYWAIVTMTTVGYGDVAPHTPMGQAIASLVMVLGYGILAVPTGIVTVELATMSQHHISTQACPACGSEPHDTDAKFCKRCGAAL